MKDSQLILFAFILLLECAAITIVESNGLTVNITVNGTPPPGFTPRGPNEYRAASGPYNFTCTATGGAGSGNYMYMWTSSSSGSAFETSATSVISRLALHSGDSGIHTCTATRGGGQSGSNSINVTIVGVGMFVVVSSGVTGTRPNNGLVISNDTLTGIRFRFFCRSNSLDRNIGEFIGLDESPVNNNFFKFSTPGNGGELRVRSTVSEDVLTASEQGVYTCRIPLKGGGEGEINIGIYPSGFSTKPNITNPLMFTPGSSSSTLTCTSTGSVATTVTFTRDNTTTVGFLRDGESKTFGRVTYQLAQTVTNRSQSTYQNVLTINQPPADIGGSTFTCSVNNAIGTSPASQSLTINVLCPGPVDIDNSMVTFTGFSVGDIATYSCDSGFELIGGANVICTQVNVSSAAFLPTPPVCRPLCPQPIDITNGMVTLTGTSVGDTATYSCDSGFELIGDVTTRTCTQVDVNSATFSLTPPFCRPLCSNPADIDYGMVTLTGNSVDDTATYSCESGFELIGDVTTTCIQMGTNSAEFSPVPPICRPLCPDPVNIENGMLTFTGNSVSDTATYSCDSGFELIGDVNITCTQVNMSSSAFLPAPPVCKPLCSDAVDIENGNAALTGTSIGDTATYSCDLGFELIGNATTTCTQMDANSPEFLPAPPVCRPLCPDPVDIDNGDVSFTGTSIGDTATYRCDSGFELIGDMTTTCTQMDGNSAFLPALPVCRPLCPDLVDIDNGNVSFTGTSIGDTATYSCDSGFELIGNMTTTCTQMDGNSAFLPAPPVCRPLCSDPVDIDNGNVSFTGNSIGDTATYSCDLGFELIGNVITTCTLVNTNSAEFSSPYCRQVENVAISVSYNPPPGVVLGLNEYRAASGPVIVNCTVTGGTENISYQWSSDCRSCPFQGATSRVITRGAVHSGDSGIHTCFATTAQGVGNASINFTVKDAGIHVFVGVPRGSLPNNGLVSLITTKPQTFRLRFFCRSDSMEENVGELIGLNGSVIHNSSFFEILKSQPGEILVQNSFSDHTSLPPSEQGVYTCRILLNNREVKEINIGIYFNDRATINITSVIFKSESSSSTLTCISTGSPPTTVTWTVKGGQTITMRDGDSETRNGTNYHLEQRVTDRKTSTYSNVLNITSTSVLVGNISEYVCTVSNVWTSDTKHIEVRVPDVTVVTSNSTNDAILGESYILNCTVLGADSLNGTIFIQWSKPGTLQTKVGTGKHLLLLLMNLDLSDAGQYTCNTTVTSPYVRNEIIAESIETLFVAIPPPTVSVAPADNDLKYAASSLTLICTISLDRMLVDTFGITVDSTWTGPLGKLFLDGSHNGRIIVTDATKGADGSYRSTVVITSLHMSDTGSYSCEAGVSHMLEFISASDLKSSDIMINVKAPDVTVIGIVNPMNGLGTAGKLFSITCMITGADNLEARFNFSLIAEDNNTVIHHDEDTRETRFIHNFTARASDAGMYTCEVTVTSTFLDEPIISNTTVTLTIQRKNDNNATAVVTGCVVGVTLLAVLVMAIVVAGIILKGRKHCEELTTIDLAKHKASKDDIQTSECVAYHQVIRHLGSASGCRGEQTHATDIAEQNPVYENAQPETVESPTDHVYEVISQV